MTSKFMAAQRNGRSYKKWFGVSLIILGLCLASVAALLYFHDQKVDSGPLPPLPQLVASPEKELPPAKVAQPSQDQIVNYHVAPDLPKFIEIPAIGLPKTRVLSLGLTSAGTIAVPSSSYDTGWYDGSAKPGQPGAMFIYGHVAGWNQGGIFYNLHKLNAGDKIIVTRGDNARFTYEVISKQLYPDDKVDMNKVLAPIDPGVPGLNLMTCTWDIVNHKSEFLNRQVVFASLVISS